MYSARRARPLSSIDPSDFCAAAAHRQRPWHMPWPLPHPHAQERMIPFSNENGTRYEANFSCWLTGMERGVAARRPVECAHARMEKARVDVSVEFKNRRNIANTTNAKSCPSISAQAGAAIPTDRRCRKARMNISSKIRPATPQKRSALINPSVLRRLRRSAAPLE